MLVGYKHDGRVGFARELGARLRAPLDAALRDAALNCDRVEGVGGTEKARAPCAGGAPGILIVTVPSRPARVRERGYRHVDVLVRIALRGGGGTTLDSNDSNDSNDSPPRFPSVGRGLLTENVPPHPNGGGGTPRAPDVPPRLLSRALRTSAGRTTQVGLGAVERQANAARIRVARPRQLRGRDVILVDDVITTGATVTAAAKSLSAAGAHVVAIVALCAVERRSRSPARRSGTDAKQGSTLRERRDGALQGPPA